MGRLSLLATACALGSVALAQRAVAAPCDPAEVMVLFDRSTSMKRGYIGTKTKWEIATGALKTVVGNYKSQTAFGLSIFPQKIAAGAPATCTTGLTLSVSPKLGSQALTDISNALANAYPGNNDWTPLGQALAELTTLDFVKALAQQPKRRYVIVVSDGAQSCPDGTNGNPDEDPEQIWEAAKIAGYAKQLKDANIKVFAIGFGKQSTGSGDDGVDPYALNQIAFLGGSARTGCDPESNDATNPLNCYVQADDEAELNAAFEEIAIEIAAETCDGVDNNCNGVVDEDLSQGCTSDCGAGTQRCVAGDWSTCTATQPDPEVCDGVDNDCDGQVDEGCACQNGQTRPCDKKVGICVPGTQRCVNGQWSPVCEGEVRGTTEVCDGVDNNCDGIGDIDCTCINGEEEVCGGPNVGQCKTGVRRCVNGDWGACVGAVGPTPETCDGIDNDCDGVIDDPLLGEDDDLPHNLCRIDQVCQNGHCLDVPPMNPPGGNAVGDAPGCACTTSSGGGAPLATLLLVALTFFVTRRRRS